MSILIRNITVVLLLVATLPWSGPGAWAAPQRTHESVLSNGMKIVVREDHRAPVVVSQVWYRVGSTYEPPGMTGLSHVLEHMMFKGTKHLEPGEFSKIVARFGGQENAFTSRDYTGYYQVLAAEHLELSLQLESERMQNLRIDDAEFAKEVEVVKEERRLRVDDRPDSAFYERFLATAHLSSSYRQPVIGWMHDLDHMQPDMLRDWYQRWYSPGNALLVVVGAVDPANVFQLAQKYFGNIPQRSVPAPREPLEIEHPGERRIRVHLRTELPRLYVAYNVPSVATAEHDWEPYALRMLAGVLDEGYSARFESELVRGSETALSAGVSYSPFSRGDALFTISGVPNIGRGQSNAALEEAFREQVARISTEPPSAAEMQRVRAQVIAGLVFHQDSLNAQANLVGSLESMGLSWRLLEDYVPRLEAVTPQQVSEVAARYLVAERRTTGELLPTADNGS